MEELASFRGRMLRALRSSLMSAPPRDDIMRSAPLFVVVAIGLALGFATTARAGWKQDGSLLSSFPEGVVASDGNGGVFGAAGGYPGQFSRLYHLISSGDTASGWVAGGLELTPGAVIIEHNSITPVGALPAGLGGGLILP